MQYRSDIEFELNLIVIPSFGISSFNTRTLGVHFVTMITTILVTRSAKSLILGIMTASSVILHALLAQDRILFSAFLVMILITISMIEEQSVQKLVEMESY